MFDAIYETGASLRSRKDGRMRAISMVFPALVLLLLTGCGGGSAYTPTVIPGMAGQWEFLATSTQAPGIQTGVEVNLQQGQALQNGVYQPTAQLSAAGSQQIAILSVDQTGFNQVPNIVFGGNCSGSGSDSLNGTVDATNNVTLSYSENGNSFSATGTLGSDHKSILGTYTSQSGSGCIDSGTFAGTAVAKLSGMYQGQLCPPGAGGCQYPQGAADNATAALSQSGSTVSINMVVTGVDNTSFSLSGPVTGNAFLVQGTFNVGGQAQTITYNGYFELTYDCLTQLIDLPSVYLVDPTYIGAGNPYGQVALLTAPLNQVCPAQ
jgi:hypothetical protein